MANAQKTGVALKLSYDLGTIDDKKVIKTRTIQGIRLDITEAELLEVAQAMLVLQEYPADVSKVDTSTITA